MNEVAIKKLMQLLEKTQEEECSCQEAFALLDEYVELITSGKEAATLMPLIKHHLEMCHCCYEEFEALRNIVETGSGWSPD